MHIMSNKAPVCPRVSERHFTLSTAHAQDLPGEGGMKYCQMMWESLRHPSYSQTLLIPLPPAAHFYITLLRKFGSGDMPSKRK